LVAKVPEFGITTLSQQEIVSEEMFAYHSCLHMRCCHMDEPFLVIGFHLQVCLKDMVDTRMFISQRINCENPRHSTPSISVAIRTLKLEIDLSDSLCDGDSMYSGSQMMARYQWELWKVKNSDYMVSVLDHILVVYWN
jgi:hypothetical protein